MRKLRIFLRNVEICLRAPYKIIKFFVLLILHFQVDFEISEILKVVEHFFPHFFFASNFYWFDWKCKKVFLKSSFSSFFICNLKIFLKKWLLNIPILEKSLQKKETRKKY